MGIMAGLEAEDRPESVEMARLVAGRGDGNRD